MKGPAARPARCVLGLFLVLAAGDVAGDGFSLRFHGNGVAAPDLDRVKIALDDPHRPVDVGIGDFTVEWWMKSLLADNDPTPVCGPGRDNWIYGNILLDRDVFGQGDLGDWGVSLRDGVVAFGVADTVSSAGICGTSNVADGEWHHVAVTRRAADGRLRIHVDGVVEGEGSGPAGDITYNDGRSSSYPGSDPFLVIGAEKHDAGAAYPSYSGHLDELRLSTVLRYDGAFTPPSAPFAADAGTAALYHFDEGDGDVVADSSGAAGGPSDGVRRFGGSPAGPEWSTDTPFAEPPCAIAEDLLLADDTLMGVGEIHEACNSIAAGPNLAIVAPGDVIFRTRHLIELREGFSVGLGAVYRAVLDPATGQP